MSVPGVGPNLCHWSPVPGPLFQLRKLRFTAIKSTRDDIRECDSFIGYKVMLLLEEAHSQVCLTLTL